MTELIAEAAGEGILLIGLVALSPLYVGGALIATTGILILVKGKKYDSSKWKYKVLRPFPVADSTWFAFTLSTAVEPFRNKCHFIVSRKSFISLLPLNSYPVQYINL